MAIEASKVVSCGIRVGNAQNIVGISMLVLFAERTIPKSFSIKSIKGYHRLG